MTWATPDTVQFTCRKCRITRGYTRLDMDGKPIRGFDSQCPQCGKKMARDVCKHPNAVLLKQPDPVFPEATHKCWDCGRRLRWQ